MTRIDADQIKDTVTNWKEEIRSRLKAKPSDDKKLYGYIKDMHAMDDMAEERGTIKNMFFSKPLTTTNSRMASPIMPARTGKQSLYPVRHSKMDSPFGMASKLSVRPMTILPSQQLKKLADKSPAPKVSPISPKAAKDMRTTLMGIREKATILRNVHDPPTDQQISSEEQAIFKKISLMLENHLSSDHNLFKSLLHDFQMYFICKYDIKIEDYQRLAEQRNLSQAEEDEFSYTCEYLCQEVIEFIQVMVKCLILFYNFDICYFRVEYEESKAVNYLPCTILNFDNLMNFATAIMFPKRVYELLQEYFIFKNRAKNDRLFSHMHLYQTEITMETLEISEKFQLKPKIRKIIVELPSERQSNATGKLNRRMASYERMTDNVPPQPQASITIEGSVDTGNDDDPYHEAIRALRYIGEVESPLEKMKVLLTTVRKIIKAINEYYKGSKDEQEVLMGDQIMSLVVYVVLKSKCKNLVAYIDYIEQFLPPKMFSTFTGYYLTVFHAACEYLAYYESAQVISE